jgi:hypothetical protein
MRVLVCALSVAAMMGSAHATGATAAPFDPSLFAEQFPGGTFNLASVEGTNSRRTPATETAVARGLPLNPGIFLEQFSEATFPLAAPDVTSDLNVASLPSFADTVELIVAEHVLALSFDDPEPWTEMSSWDIEDESISSYIREIAASTAEADLSGAKDSLDALRSPGALTGLVVPARTFITDDDESLFYGGPDPAATGSVSFVQVPDLALEGYEDR